jgi:periplasmic divalent cation tolerance protein
MSDKKTVVFAYIPFATQEEAQRLGRQLVEKQLAACVNILPSMQSIYPWQGKIESQTECLMIAKTEKKGMEALAAEVLEHHSYDVPCIQFLKTKDGNPEYASWLHDNLK